MARKSPKTTKKTEEISGGATVRQTGPGGPAGQGSQDAPGTPGKDLTAAELGGMAAGATRIRIKVDFADLSSPEGIE